MKRARPFDFPLFFRALADQTRLRLLNLIGEREVCVCFFVEVLGAHQPKISRHLAYLRDAGIVTARREGKWMHYRIAKPGNPIAKQMLEEILNWLKSDRQMQVERAKLEGICCSPRLPVRLSQAPIPKLNSRPEDPVSRNPN